jgi:hypothetical protein
MLVILPYAVKEGKVNKLYKVYSWGGKGNAGHSTLRGQRGQGKQTVQSVQLGVKGKCWSFYPTRWKRARWTNCTKCTVRYGTVQCCGSRMFYYGSEHFLIPDRDPNIFSSGISERSYTKSGGLSYFFLASHGVRSKVLVLVIIKNIRNPNNFISIYLGNLWKLLF